MYKLCIENEITLPANLCAIEFARSHFDRLIGIRSGRILFDQPVDDGDKEMAGKFYKIRSAE